MRELTPLHQADTSYRLEISNRKDEIHRMSEWLNARTAEMQLPEKLRFHLDLCANEAVTNVVSYAFADDALHTIQLHLRRDENRITLTIEDDGQPFNPLSIPESPHPADLASARIGGLGIKLIRHIMPQCDYTRHQNRNILTFSASMSDQ